MSQTPITEQDVLAKLNTAADTLSTGVTQLLAKADGEIALVATHEASADPHGLSDASSPFRTKIQEVVEEETGKSTTIQNLAQTVADQGVTYAALKQTTATQSAQLSTLQQTVSGQTATIENLETTLATAETGLTKLKDDLESGAIGGGSGGTPVSVPDITGPDTLAIGFANTFSLQATTGLSGGKIVQFIVQFAGASQTVNADGTTGTGTVSLIPDAKTVAGTSLTISVRAKDSYGYVSKAATKTVTAVQSAVQNPTLTAPTAGAYVSPGSVIFTTSAFATIGASDTHAASRFKLASDAAGNNVVYDSGRNTTDKLTHTATLTTTLTPGATYYAFAQHEGSVLGVSGWSAPVAVVASSVLAPSITAPAENAEIVYSSGLTVTASAFTCAGSITDTHASTDWRITSDVAGSTVVAEAAASSDKTSHTFTGLPLTDGGTYYLWARYTGAACGTGPWSAARAFKAKKGVTTPSGRLLYMNATNDGIVMEHQFTKDGSTAKFVIALAKDRTKKKFGTYGTDMSGLTNYTQADTSGTWYLDGKANSGAITRTDAQMRSAWSASLDEKTAKQNCDIWMTRNTATDTQGIVGVPAVAYCRSVTIGGVSCDLPNEQELLLMRLEANEIDKLDPTVAQYPTYALGSANTAGFWNFGGTTYAFSSTEYDSSHVRYVDSNGNCNCAGKLTEYGVAPVREI